MATKDELIAMLLASPSLCDGASESYKDYLNSLRVNRNALVGNILSSDDKKNGSGRKRDLTIKAKNIQNQTRGKLGELLGRVALTQNSNATDSDLVTDKVVFETPFGKRRIDIYWEQKRIAVETKMGYITNSKSIRSQIDKDAYLLRNKIIESSVWLLIKSGSKNVKSNLNEHGISYREGWPI